MAKRFSELLMEVQMRRVMSIFAFLMAPALTVAGPVRDETVAIPSGDEKVSAFLARPDGPGPHPALILIHEWWGLNEQIKGEARKFAEQGFVALAPDLFRGGVTGDPSVAHELMRGMPQDRAVRDLKAAFGFLSARGDVKKGKIASIGWCMGGGLSLQLAVNEPQLAAVVVYYGSMPTDPAAIEKIKASLLGNFGAEDRGINVDAVRTFEKALKAAGKPADIKIYPGAGHAFQNSNNKLGYHQTAAEDAWKRTLAFLNRTLK